MDESYNGECLKEVERLVETIKAADFKKKETKRNRRTSNENIIDQEDY